MKDKKDKRKHHESTIGKIIYGFLLFAPLLAILSTCLYATFNKNAYLSYSGADENRELIEINNELQINKTYHFDSDSNTTNQTYNEIFVYNNSPLYDGTTIFIDENNLATFKLYYTTTTYILFTDKQGHIFYKSYNIAVHYQFDFTVSSNQTINPIYNNYIKEVATNVENRLDNVFYNSIDKVQQSPLFNWSKNTAIYTVLNNTCNTLGITNTFWPMLMAYWLIISVIYILYDIVLMMLVIFHRKVHCLQDSI